MKTDAAGNVEWSHEFNGSRLEFWLGNLSEQRGDGWYFLRQQTGTQNLVLTKIDTVGVVEWSVVYPNSGNNKIAPFGRASMVSSASDDGFLLLGSVEDTACFCNRILIIKTDVAGTEQWRKILGSNSTNTGYDIIAQSDGNYLVLGKYEGPSTNHTYIMKIDGNGNELWTQQYNAQNNTNGIAGTGRRLLETSTNDIIIVGSRSDSAFGPALSKALILKADAAGNELWSKAFDIPFSHATHVVEHPNGNFTMVGGEGNGGVDLFVIQVDAAGNEVWRKIYDFHGNTDRAEGVVLDQNGDIIVTGYTYNPQDDYQGFIMKLNSDGDLYTHKIIGYVKNDQNDDCVADTAESLD